MRKNSILLIVFFIALIYVFLPLTILIGIIPFDCKFYVLTFGAFFVYFVLRLKKITNADLGITTQNIRKSIVTVLPITIFLAFIGLLCWICGFSRITPNENWLFFVFYIFISSPAQEFLYRGALVALLEKINLNYLMAMLISSLLYSFVHIIYRDALTLLMTFIIGVIWFRDYRKTKNLLGVSVSHAVLGVVTILGGIIN